MKQLITLIALWCIIGCSGPNIISIDDQSLRIRVDTLAYDDGKTHLYFSIIRDTVEINHLHYQVLCKTLTDTDYWETLNKKKLERRQI